MQTNTLIEFEGSDITLEVKRVDIGNVMAIEVDHHLWEVKRRDSEETGCVILGFISQGESDANVFEVYADWSGSKAIQLLEIFPSLELATEFLSKR